MANKPSKKRRLPARKPAAKRQKSRAPLIAGVCSGMAVIIVIGVMIFMFGNKSSAPGGDTVSVGAAYDWSGDKLPVATLEAEGFGAITLELYPGKAPNTVANFIALANSGFYDGLIFHRIIDGFMIQGGDPQGTGTGGPGYQIPGEFPNAGFRQNDISHAKGVISMARQGGTSSDPRAGDNTAGSQFFICDDDSAFLDGEYAAFGRVTSGQDVVDAISEAETDALDKPLSNVVIKSIRVETFGYEYPAPVKS